MDKPHPYESQEKELVAIPVETIARICAMADMTDRMVVLAPLSLMMIAKDGEEAVGFIVERIAANHELRSAWFDLTTSLVNLVDKDTTLSKSVDGMLNFAKTMHITGCGGSMVGMEEGGWN